jgi:hypothetical protein
MLSLVATALAGPLADCPRTFDTAELMAAVESAELNFANQEAEGFAGARMVMLLRLQCQRDPLTPKDIAQVHLVQALAAHLLREEAHVQPALAGMLAAQPDLLLPDAYVPEGHRLRAAMPGAAASVPTSPRTPLIGLLSGWIEVDGAFSEDAPTGRAVVLQKMDAGGDVVESRYVWPEDGLGDWQGDGTKPVQPRAPRRVAAHPHRLPLIAGGAASVVAGGVLYALAAGAEREALDPSVPVPDAEAARGRADGLTWAWIGASGAALGLGAAVVLTW